MAENKRSRRTGWVIAAALLVAAAVLGLYLCGVFTGRKDGGTDAALPAAAEGPAATRTPDGAIPVSRSEGEMYFPEEKNWVYHFVYAYPALRGDSLTVAKINDTYRDILDEMVQLVQPMFANAEAMRFDGHNEVKHDFTVTCNSDRLLSVVQTRSQTQGEEKTVLNLDALTFNTAGDLAGNVTTLRGVTLLLAGVDPAVLDDVPTADYPQLARIIDSSSDEMADALLTRLYPEFQALQNEGVIGSEWTWEDYETEFSPAQNFYVTGEGKIVFFFPPMMMTSPSFDPPSFSFTPAELEEML